MSAYKWNEHQAKILSSYDDGAHSWLLQEPISPFDKDTFHNTVGDGLILFLLIEFSDEEGCSDEDTARRRAQAVMDDITAVYEAL